MSEISKQEIGFSVLGLQVAQLVRAYYEALLSQGFADAVAIRLTESYQVSILGMMKP
jgi:hypothetical protein